MSNFDFSTSTSSKDFSDPTTTETTFTPSETSTTTFSEIDNLNFIDIFLSEFQTSYAKKKYIKNFAKWVLDIYPNYNLNKLKYDIQLIFFS
jgi:hypothetical protein